MALNLSFLGFNPLSISKLSKKKKNKSKLKKIKSLKDSINVNTKAETLPLKSSSKSSTTIIRNPTPIPHKSKLHASQSQSQLSQMAQYRQMKQIRSAGLSYGHSAGSPMSHNSYYGSETSDASDQSIESLFGSDSVNYSESEDSGRNALYNLLKKQRNDAIEQMHKMKKQLKQKDISLAVTIDEYNYQIKQYQDRIADVQTENKKLKNEIQRLVQQQQQQQQDDEEKKMPFSSARERSKSAPKPKPKQQQLPEFAAKDIQKESNNNNNSINKLNVNKWTKKKKSMRHKKEVKVEQSAALFTRSFSDSYRELFEDKYNDYLSDQYRLYNGLMFEEPSKDTNVVKKNDEEKVHLRHLTTIIEHKQAPLGKLESKGAVSKN